MGHYSDFYQAEKDSNLIKAHCPEWVKERYPHEVQVAISNGKAAEKELKKLKEALKVLKRAVKDGLY